MEGSSGVYSTVGTGGRRLTSKKWQHMGREKERGVAVRNIAMRDVSHV